MTASLPDGLAFDPELLRIVERANELLLKSLSNGPVNDPASPMILDQDELALATSSPMLSLVDHDLNDLSMMFHTDVEDSDHDSMDAPSSFAGSDSITANAQPTFESSLQWPPSPLAAWSVSESIALSPEGESFWDVTSGDSARSSADVEAEDEDGDVCIWRRDDELKCPSTSRKRARVLSEEEVEMEMELLRKETAYLTAQYDYLVSKTQSTKRYRALAKQRRRTEQQQSHSLNQKAMDNETMQQLLEQQKVYVETFRAMLALAPVNDVRLSLMTPMDVYIHLGTNLLERRRSIMRLRDEKLDATLKYIEHKARGLDVNKPHHYFDVFDKFGKVYTTTFMINKFEDVTVHQVVRLIHQQTSGLDDSIARIMGCSTLREELDSQQCTYMHQRMEHIYNEAEGSSFELPALESNAIFFCKETPEGAVMAVDSVDKDDLYPYDERGGKMRKDVSCGMVLTRYQDDNGVEGVIIKRFFLAKIHSQPAKLPEKAQEFLLTRIRVVNARLNSIFSSREMQRAAAQFPRVGC